MHIPDAVLSPSMAAVTSVGGAAFFVYALRKLEKQSGEKTVVLMGMMSSFLFAAQMVNFPIFPGASGHLLGGLLASVLLGPWAGACVVGAVLIVQCLIFGDGGVTALGANFFNMGLIGAVGGYVIYDPIRRAIGGRAGVLIGSMIAAWLSVILAAGAFAVELAMGGRGSFLTVLGWMTLVHAAIGLGEAIITGVVVRFVLLTRPDFLYQPDKLPTTSARWRQTAVAGLAISMAVAVFLAPFASTEKDGLENVGGWFGFLREEAPTVLTGLIPDYKWNLFPAAGMGVATAAAGLVGTLVVFAVGLGLARIFARGHAEGVGPDAA